MRNSLVVLIGFILQFLAFAASPGMAETFIAPNIEVQLLSERPGVAPGRPFTVAMRMKPEPGWHLYWRYAGDSGAAPKFHWMLNGEPIDAEVLWPYPKRIPFGPLLNYGYDQEVFILAEIEAPKKLQPGAEAKLSVDAEWLVCQEECIPGNGVFNLSLPVLDELPAPSPEWVGAFSETRKALPVPSSEPAFVARYEDKRYVIEFIPATHFQISDLRAEFFPYRGGVIENAAPQELRQDGKYLALSIPEDGAATAPSSTLEGVVVTNQPWDGAHGTTVAVEMNAAVSGVPGGSSAAAAAAASAPEAVGNIEMGILTAIVFAFLGGLILNLMPCVFPIISLKVISFVEGSQHSSFVRKAHGLLYAAGIVISFLALAAVILAVQAAGTRLGWGFQLQSPEFVVAMALLMFAIGLNLMGIFEVGSFLQRLGGSVRMTDGLSSSFFSGVLATVLATPCTAPFMGSALAFALTLPTYQALIIFVSLGLGMALPYVVLSFSPGLVRFLPRPGPWMTVFKQAMAFPLFGAVIWLLWVLNIQRGPIAVMMMLIALLVLFFGLWLYGLMGAPTRGRFSRGFSAALALISISGAYLLGTSVEASQEITAGSERGAIIDSWGQTWEAFSEERLAELTTARRPVYVDFTAAWCITCQVNKRLVFGSESVRNLVRERGITLLRADWTNKDEKITRALAHYGRRGVPLNLLFKGDGTEPVIFPALLTPGIVEAEILQVPPLVVSAESD